MTKGCGSFFLVLLSVTNLKELFTMGPQAIPTIAVWPIRAFCKNLRGCWKHKLLRKSNPDSEKNYLTNFSRIIEHDKCQATFL